MRMEEKREDERKKRMKEEKIKGRQEMVERKEIEGKHNLHVLLLLIIPSQFSVYVNIRFHEGKR